ncbi:MAG: hypothetical protein EA411_12800, partial [Saprospirales bacterium]
MKPQILSVLSAITVAFLFSNATLLANPGNIPVCHPPTEVSAVTIDNSTIKVSIGDVSAKPEDIRYRIRVLKDDKFQYFNLFWGNELDIDVEPTIVDKIYIQKVCDGSFYTYSIASEWIAVKIKEDLSFDVDTCLAFSHGYLTQEGDSVIVNYEGPDPVDGYGYIFSYRFCNSQEIIHDTIAHYCNPELDIKFVVYEGMELRDICLFQITLLYGSGLKCENQPGGHGSGGFDHSHIDFSLGEYNICSSITVILEGAGGAGGDEEEEGGDGGSMNDSTVVENCGEEFDWNISGVTPLTTLSVGDTIHAFGFPVVVSSVTGSFGHGKFSGTGDVRLPFQNKIGSVEFQSVQLNSSHELIDGQILSFSSNPGELDEIISK